MTKSLLMLMTLTVAVFCSAIAVVYTTHATRQLFSENRVLEKKLDALGVEWGQLQLERGTWATQARIERLARRRLDMYVPEFEDIKMVQQ